MQQVSSIERKLTTILSADVVSFSKMMGIDEVSTLESLKSCRAVIDDAVASHHGRIFGDAGDSVIAEFASPLEALVCALDFQRVIGERNQSVEDPLKMEFRVGINIGEVIIDGENLYGDGVNVAARVQALANPAGVCVSRKVYNEVKRKLNVLFVDGGMQHLKNIDDPVSIYHVQTVDNFETGQSPADTGGGHGTDRAPPKKIGFDKPSIAVLPFTNMSADPEQGFFADGITEDIITGLSRFPHLVVVARNSTFTYKDKSVNVKEVGEALGVEYVVEGSVRKAGNRVRVTVQLVHAGSGEHIWAERYDRELTDIFELQDELCNAIVATMPGRLEAAAAKQVSRKAPQDMAAYDYLLAAKIHHHKFTEVDNAAAMALLNKAIDLEPGFAAAHAWKACVLGQALARGFIERSEKVLKDSRQEAEIAYRIDENDVEANRILCEWEMFEGNWDKARLHQERAYSANPNDPRLVAQRGELLTWLGSPEEGAKLVTLAMRLDPYDAHTRAHLLGRALFCLERYDDALKAYQKIPLPRVGHLADMAACLARLGRTDEAKSKVDDILEIDPAFTASAYVSGLYYTDARARAHHLEGLRMAGLPD